MYVNVSIYTIHGSYGIAIHSHVLSVVDMLDMSVIPDAQSESREKAGSIKKGSVSLLGSNQARISNKQESNFSVALFFRICVVL